MIYGSCRFLFHPFIRRDKAHKIITKAISFFDRRFGYADRLDKPLFFLLPGAAGDGSKNGDPMNR